MERGKIQDHGLLRVHGGRIVDMHGKPFVLRGVSLFWSQWKPEFFNEPLVVWLRDDWNINVIRAPLAVHHGGFLEDPAAQAKKIERVIRGAVDAGIYVIVDWHAHEKELDAALLFFDGLSRRYRDCANIIYEVWNEPAPRYTWQRDIAQYCECIIGAIRRNGARNLVVAGTENFCQHPQKAAAAPLADDNVAYSAHFYAATHGEELRRRIEEAKSRGQAILVTEYGTSEANGDGAFAPRQMTAWWSFLESFGIGHVNWSISDKTETAAALLPGASPLGRWPQSMLTASGRLVRDQLRSTGHKV
jgi:endoglucanase